tara:strand:- start:3068 stop:3946 length:879 start_codon:yes stop_codon:yes gene_type:complete
MDEILKILKESFIEISYLIQNRNLFELGNRLDKKNISNDFVKILDEISNNILKNNLIKCNLIKCIGSEEEDNYIVTSFPTAPYLICFDPLDGSSNIDVNITTGTIFTVYKYNDANKITSGKDIVMAGYSLYSSALQYVCAYNNNISMYQYFSKESSFKKIRDNIKMVDKGNIYSINESYKNIWCNQNYNKLIDKLVNENYSARWVGSLVADAHRTLIKGGLFAYPDNNKSKNGKIRLLYEAYPFAFIFEMGGGSSSNGSISILDIPFPKNIHQRTPIILSSKHELEYFKNLN